VGQEGKKGPPRQTTADQCPTRWPMKNRYGKTRRSRSPMLGASRTSFGTERNAEKGRDGGEEKREPTAIRQQNYTCESPPGKARRPASNQRQTRRCRKDERGKLVAGEERLTDGIEPTRCKEILEKPKKEKRNTRICAEPKKARYR